MLALVIVQTNNCLDRKLILGQNLCTKRYLEKCLKSTPIVVKIYIFKCLQINGFNGVYNIWVKNKSIEFSVVKKVFRY